MERFTYNRVAKKLSFVGGIIGNVCISISQVSKLILNVLLSNKYCFPLFSKILQWAKYGCHNQSISFSPISLILVWAEAFSLFFLRKMHKNT